MTTTYTTRDEAINGEIIAAIEAGDADRADYDIEAIADEVLTTRHEGSQYRYLANEDVDFWACVAAHSN